MKVTLIASTQLRYTPESVQDTNFGHDFWSSSFNDAHWEHIDTLAEFAGRACYQAWEKPNPKTATNEGYLNNIINQGHFSVLEHSSATFYIEGVSRSLTHELVRHRHLSYSELSQRYVDVAETEFITPPALVEYWEGSGGHGQDHVIEDTVAIEEAVDAYLAIAQMLEEKGLPRKRAREAARAVMPNCTETKIVVTGNLRAWRDFLYKRWHVAADAEIRALAGEILSQLREIAPHSVQDIKEAPFQ